MQPLSIDSITVDEPGLPFAKDKNVRLDVLRLDKVHPFISGNKWFKLKYHLQKARKENKKSLLTFGGAYSSHIVATAAAGRVFGFKTIGIVRGEEPRTLSHSLRDAMGFGMDLFFVSRTDYRNKIWPAKLLKKPDEPYVINEGGYGPTGVEGAMEILDFCEQEHYSHIACAVGTSTMMAGLIKTSLTGQQVLGFSVLKNNLNLEKDLCNLLSPGDREKKFQVIHDYHFGGYAKYTRELIGFMNEFYQASLIPLDFVYTAKLFFGVIAMMENNYFPPGSHVLLIHSGGLQGNLSLPKGALVF